MGSRGPVPTDPKVLQMRGTYRADRHAVAPSLDEPLTKVPTAPNEFSELERKLWRQTAKRLIAVEGLVTRDLDALEAYVKVYARAREAEAAIAIKGRTVLTPQGEKRAPELLTAEKARAEMRTLWQKFGMSPADRARIRTPARTPKAPSNPFADTAANG